MTSFEIFDINIANTQILVFWEIIRCWNRSGLI